MSMSGSPSCASTQANRNQGTDLVSPKCMSASLSSPVLTSGRFVQVRDSMVCIMLRFPPTHTESNLCADRERSEVVVEAGLEHLVVRKVMGQPTTLLPEKT